MTGVPVHRWPIVQARMTFSFGGTRPVLNRMR
jgi:hypothetical protein